MRPAANRRLACGATLALALLLAGCSVGASNPAPETLVASTSHGLSYRLVLTVDGDQHCATTTYRSALADGRPILQSSHICGPTPAAGQPMLVQARTSAQSMLVDVAPGGCGVVMAGPTHAVLRPVVSRCSIGRPVYRVTILPSASRLVIVGIAGAPVINFSRHVCRMGLCITSLIPARILR
jgi:hypothetical protein